MIKLNLYNIFRNHHVQGNVLHVEDLNRPGAFIAPILKELRPGGNASKHVCTMKILL